MGGAGIKNLDSLFPLKDPHPDLSSPTGAMADEVEPAPPPAAPDGPGGGASPASESNESPDDDGAYEERYIKLARLPLHVHDIVYSGHQRTRPELLHREFKPVRAPHGRALSPASAPLAPAGAARPMPGVQLVARRGRRGSDAPRARARALLHRRRALRAQAPCPGPSPRPPALLPPRTWDQMRRPRPRSADERDHELSPAPPTFLPSALPFELARFSLVNAPSPLPQVWEATTLDDLRERAAEAQARLRELEIFRRAIERASE